MPEPTLNELEPGLVQITMPLPWALDHVHCYAVDDAEGWTLIDCGLGTPGTGRRGSFAVMHSACRSRTRSSTLSSSTRPTTSP